ncbi:MAG: hypothetical protein K2I89_08130, partial [Muribaculaceae bacterium]|nr:hypothetical protein [Muribaculaceae bacterium]
MKKLLLFIMVITLGFAIGHAQSSSDPVFPDKINVSADSKTITIAYDEDEDFECPLIVVSGTTTKDNVTLTFDLPAGWDGVIGGEMGGGMRKAPADWPTLDEFREEFGNMVKEVVEGKQLVFPVDGAPHGGMYFLYSGDQVDKDHLFMITVSVEKEDEPALEFPEEFTVTTDPEGLECEQAFEYGVHNIDITGESTKDEVTVSLAVPEGWDGFIALEYDEYAPDIKPLAKAPKAAEEIEWGSLEEMLADGYVKTNGFTFPVDEEQSGTLLLYKGDKVDTTNEIYVNVNVEKTSEPEPVLEFPETFNVSVNPEGLDVDKYDDVDAYYVVVKGKTEEKEVSVTFEVPEGWDGFVGGANPNGRMAKAAAKVPVNEFGWMSLDAVIQSNGFEKTNTFTFDTDAAAYDYMVCLYKGDLIYTGRAIRLMVEVEGPAEPEGPVFPEAFTVTTDPEGLECEQGFEYGVHNIDITGESTKDEVTVSLAV